MLFNNGFKVRGLKEDLLGGKRIMEKRTEKRVAASTVAKPEDHIKVVANKLHPGYEEYKITKIYDSSKTAKTFRFEPVNGHIPVFQSCQYVSLRFEIGNSKLTRAYSMSSAPYEARGEKPFFEITVRRNQPYLVPDYMFENLKEGDIVECDLPFGHFYYEPLRDTKNIVALAGGVGITPFYSMAKEIEKGKMQDVVLVYKCGHEKLNRVKLKSA